jgi:hypothetical protein
MFKTKDEHIIKPLMFKRKAKLKVGPLSPCVDIPYHWLRTIESKKGKRVIGFECDVSNELQLILRPIFES